MSPTIQPHALLRAALKADLVLSAATALSLLLGGEMLSRTTGLPEPLLFGVGLALLPWLALLAWVATRTRLPVALVWAVIVLNGVWAVDCTLVATGAMPLADWQLTSAGIGFVIAQAVGVVLLALFEYLGLARSHRIAT